MSYHLFEVVGIELEYMVVRSSDLKVSPIVDKLLTRKNGSLTSDVENGRIEWSNELVAHVVELKTNGPTSDVEGLAQLFSENVREINLLLSEFDAQLLPTASHPLMDPRAEMKLWEHNYSRIYALYNRIFDCHGHGWSNVQSMHINLPFANDEEFERLHAAVRLLLPIIPGLCASSPIFEGKATGFKDSRMQVYKDNQKEIPEMTGKVIPERVFSRKEYTTQIFEPINAAIRPYDSEKILDQHFLNSRGAIARFDRGAIEIRVIDIQECPKADIAIAVLIIESLKLLVSEELISLKDQKIWHEDALFAILDEVNCEAEDTRIVNPTYLDAFDFEKTTRVGDIWKKLFQKVKGGMSRAHCDSIEFILKNGSLSTRILEAVGNDFSEEHIKSVYRRLGSCLENNEFFQP